MATFPDVGVHELYGSTEAGIVTNLRPVDQHRKAGLGRPPVVPHRAPGRRRRRAARCAAGEPGELFSRSPYLMNGYHDDPDATAACTTDDGFVTCGDIVVQDDEGYVHVVDRKKDLIISGGVNIYPREVEDVLVTHASVAEAAVVGEPDEGYGERVVAHLVLRPGHTLDDDLRRRSTRTAGPSSRASRCPATYAP